MGKIHKALIIRRLQVKLSMQYAEMCAKSCSEHGLDYEFIDAVEFMDCQSAFASVGVKKASNYKNTMGNCCCHASHIKCWRRIIELDKPCIILEHDALILGDVTRVDIPDMAVVTFGHRVSERTDYTPPRPAEKLVKISRSVGVHACGLTPETARWLVHHAETQGISIGVDRWLMMQTKSRLPLYVCEPPQAVCWARKSTSNFTPEHKETIDPGQSFRGAVVNYRESITPGWREGLKR